MLISHKLVKVAGGHSPRVSPSTAPELENEVDIDMVEILPSSRNEQKKLRKDCMRRDNHQCIISGVIDPDHFSTLPPNDRKGRRHSPLECAHILPFALREFNGSNALQV